MISAAAIEQLSVAERIQLVEDIWDTIAANPKALEVSKELGEEMKSCPQVVLVAIAGPEQSSTS